MRGVPQPYGIQRENPGITLSNYKFTDQELDTESGLYNYDARLYDPVIGRFISPDSIVPDLYVSQDLNRYSYCLNNPLEYIDPNGHVTISFGGTSMGIDISGQVSTVNGPTKGVSLSVSPNVVGAEISITEDNIEGDTSQHGFGKLGGYVTDEEGNIVGIYGGLHLGIPGISSTPLGKAVQALGKAFEKIGNWINDNSKVKENDKAKIEDPNINNQTTPQPETDPADNSEDDGDGNEE